MKGLVKSQIVFAIISLLILILFALSPKNGDAQPVPKRGGTLNVEVTTDILNLDPHSSGASIQALVWEHAFERLVGYGENMELIPVLAERWDISPDFKTYTFHLRKGRLFHNGREMVADDVKYTFERILNPSNGCPRRADFNNIDRIEVLNKYTVCFRMKKGDTSLLSKMAYTAPVLGIMPRAVEKDERVITKPIGTGPFSFVEWKPGRYVLLERFKEYKPLPPPSECIAYLDKIKFIPVTEDSSATMALLNKEVDFGRVPLSLIEKYKTDYAKRGIVTKEYPGNSWNAMFFGMNRPITDNVKFRQACAYAIDQENVMKMAVRGYGVMNPSLVPIQSQYYTPFHKKWYKKDADKAKELLKEMGYKGEEIVIDVSKKYMWHYNQVVAIQSDLAAVGIKSRINVIEWSTLMEKFYNGDFQILSTSATARPEPQLAYSILIPYGFEEKYPRMTKIRAEIEGTMDIKTRKNLFEEAHALHYEGVPCIVLYWKSSLAAHWDYVKGFKLPWTTGLPFWGVWLDK